jgi:hypothetical protein
MGLRETSCEDMNQTPVAGSDITSSADRRRRTDADWSGEQTRRQAVYRGCKGDWPALGKSRQLLHSFPTSHCLATSLLNENH